MHRWTIVHDDCLIIAVADGAGSAARADEGAQCAVEAAVAHLEAACAEGAPTDETAWHGAILATFSVARDAVLAHAEGAGASLRDYATTLTVVAATPDRFAVGQIGDGLAVVETGDGSIRLAVSPQRGEYANEVALLTMPDAIERAAIAVCTTPIRAVAVTTDGLLRLAARVPSYAPHAPFFRPLFAFAAEATDATVATRDLAAFLSSARVTQRTDDDTTLVLAAWLTPDADADPSPAPPAETQDSE